MHEILANGRVSKPQSIINKKMLFVFKFVIKDTCFRLWSLEPECKLFESGRQSG